MFAQLPAPMVDALHAKGWKFYQFIAGGGCRFMCAWDTTEASVDALLADIHSVADVRMGLTDFDAQAGVYRMSVDFTYYR